MIQLYCTCSRTVSDLKLDSCHVSHKEGMLKFLLVSLPFELSLWVWYLWNLSLEKFFKACDHFDFIFLVHLEFFHFFHFILVCCVGCWDGMSFSLGETVLTSSVDEKVQL